MKTGTILGILGGLTAAGMAYYFLVYRPKQEDEVMDEETEDQPPVSVDVATSPSSPTPDVGATISAQATLRQKAKEYGVTVSMYKLFKTAKTNLTEDIKNKKTGAAWSDIKRVRILQILKEIKDPKPQIERAEEKNRTMREQLYKHITWRYRKDY